MINTVKSWNCLNYIINTCGVRYELMARNYCVDSFRIWYIINSLHGDKK